MASIKHNRVKASIPTASMADIAFLLIVFFLLTTSMSQDKGLGITLPPADSATQVPRRNISNVWINSIGEIAHDEDLVTLEQLRSRIQAMTEGNPELIISIKTDQDAHFEWFVDVIDEIKMSGNVKISIAEPDF